MLEKFQRLFGKSLLALGFFLFSSIFIYINYIASPGYRAPVLKSLFLTGVFIGIFILCDFLFHYIEKKNTYYYIAAGVLLFSGLILRLYWINSVDTIQVSDFGRMWESAGEIAKGDYSRFKENGYLYTYPHLAFTTLFYSLVYRVSSGSIYAMKIVNLILSMVSALLVYIIANEISNRKKGVAFFVMAINAPFIFFNNILDSQNLAIPLFYGCVYIYLRVFKDKLSPLYLILCGVLLSLGNLMRSVGPIFLIAILMHMILFTDYKGLRFKKKNRGNQSLKLMCIPLLLLSMYLTTFILNYGFIWGGVFQKATWETEGNLILYINAGFNHDSNGMWNQYDYDLLRDVDYDYEKAEIEAKRRLSERLEDKDKVMNLISSKYRTQWGAGDFGGLYWSTLELRSNPKSTNDMLVWFNYHFYFIQSFYSAIILSILYKIYRLWHQNELDKEFIFGVILFIGFVCLHTLIEMQPRYGYIAMPMITALGISGIGTSFRKEGKI